MTSPGARAGAPLRPRRPSQCRTVQCLGEDQKLQLRWSGVALFLIGWSGRLIFET